MITKKLKDLFSQGKEVNKKKSILKDRLSAVIEANDRDKTNEPVIIMPSDYWDQLVKYRAYEAQSIEDKGDALDRIMYDAKHDEVKRRLVKILAKDDLEKEDKEHENN